MAVQFNTHGTELYEPTMSAHLFDINMKVMDVTILLNTRKNNYNRSNNAVVAELAPIKN
jgi:hypothetical protein